MRNPAGQVVAGCERPVCDNGMWKGIDGAGIVYVCIYITLQLRRAFVRGCVSDCGPDQPHF